MTIPRLAIAALLSLSLLLGGFEEDIRSPDSWVRYKAVQSLNGGDKEDRKKLLALLKNTDPRLMDWFIRWGVVEAFTKANLQDIEADVREQLKKGEPLVQEAMCTVIAKKSALTFVPDLIATLGNKDGIVRRSAVRALVGFKDKRVLEALIARFAKEDKQKGFREWVQVKSALEILSGEFLGENPSDWASWWEFNKDKFAFDKPKTKEEDKDKKARDEKAEAEGKKAQKHEKTVAGAKLKFETRGSGIVPLLVIPAGAYHETYFEPYLQSLEDACRIFYIKMPKVTDFEESKLAAYKLPTGQINYPIDLLVEAFDALRKEFKLSKFAILSHMDNCVVAMRFVTKFPQSVSHLIVISGNSGQQAAGNNITRMENEGRNRKDTELEHAAQSLFIDLQTNKRKYEARDGDEAAALERKHFNTMFANPLDLGVGIIYKKARREPEAGPVILIAPFNLGQEGKGPVPTLVMVGERSLWASVPDAQKIAEHYSGATQVFKSADMPFVEENGAFTSTVKGFLKKFPYRSPKK